MSAIPEGVVVYLLVALVVAGASHTFVLRPVLACLASALISPLAFAALCAATGQKVTVPPLAVFLLFATVSLSVAVAVGVPFLAARYVRARQKSNG